MCFVNALGLATYDFDRLGFAFQVESLEAAVANSREKTRYNDAAHVDVAERMVVE